MQEKTMDCEPTNILPAAKVQKKKKKKSFLLEIPMLLAKLFSLILSIADLQCYVSLRGAAE